MRTRESTIVLTVEEAKAIIDTGAGVDAIAFRGHLTVAMITALNSMKYTHDHQGVIHLAIVERDTMETEDER